MWRFMRSRWLIITVVWVVVISFALVACSPTPRPGPARPGGTNNTGLGVQLFQWTWPAIAAECPTLANLGYTFVQTSPPQESIVGQPWWVVYQPVSYKLESTLGTRAEFAEMVSTCRDFGVAVYADAVINHMTGQDSGVGTAGTKFTHYDYPGLYTPADFHHCGLTSDDDIGDYTNKEQVQTCELLNLADLDTSNPQVQQVIADYLMDLQSLGVAGFRIDAAKHIPAEDLSDIMDLLPDGAALILEVIRGDNEPIQPEDYESLGRVQEFAFARYLNDAFGTGSLSNLTVMEGNTASGMVTNQKAISFVDNHDTERNGETLSIANPKPYLWAEIFMLAYGYGTPVIFSGYSFDDYDAGPPRVNKNPGRVQAANCEPVTAPWTCNHRNPAVAGMNTFYHDVAGSYTDLEMAGPLVGIMRGTDEHGRSYGRGFVAINTGDQAAAIPWYTKMDEGSYCNLVVPECSQQIKVDANGAISTKVPAGGAVAISAKQKVSATP